MNDFPPTLNEAIASEPIWLLAWLMILVATHFLAIVFIPFRIEGDWKMRWEPLAILASFFFAGYLMSLLYAQFGYVRLLGLAHIVGWAPIYGWLLWQRKQIGYASGWGKYVHWYLLVAGASLLVDLIDTVRYLAGEMDNLYLRWG